MTPLPDLTLCAILQKKELEAQKVQQPAPEELVDTAPIISTSVTPPLEQAEGAEVSISTEELKELNQVVQTLKADKDALEELKEDREEYIEVCHISLTQIQQNLSIKISQYNERWPVPYTLHFVQEDLRSQNVTFCLD